MVVARALEIRHQALGINTQPNPEEQVGLKQRTNKAVRQNNVEFFKDLDLNYFYLYYYLNMFFKNLNIFSLNFIKYMLFISYLKFITIY